MNQESVPKSLEEVREHLDPRDRWQYRILVLETAEHVAELTETLETGAYEVVPIETIKQAFDFLESLDHVDLIIAAAHLETENVFEFLKAVKKSKHLAEIPVLIFCTDPGAVALATSEATESASNILGADSYLLMETFDPLRVLQEIEAHVPEAPPQKTQDQPEASY